MDADALAGREVVVGGENHKTVVPAIYPDAGGATFEIRFGYFSVQIIFCIRRQQNVFRTYGCRPQMPVAVYLRCRNVTKLRAEYTVFYPALDKIAAAEKTGHLGIGREVKKLPRFAGLTEPSV